MEEEPIEEETDEEYEEYLRANVHRDEELIQFVDELLTSEDFYVAQVKHCQSSNIKTQEELSYENVFVEYREEPRQISLVRQAKRLRAIEKRLEEFLRNRATEDMIERQEKSIQVIKEKIAEAKRGYLCHKEERLRLEKQKTASILKAVQDEYEIVLKQSVSKIKAVEKVLTYRKIRYTQCVERKRRTIAIVRKIFNEFKRQDEIDELRNRRYDTKVVRKEKILKDVEVVGVKIELLPRPQSKIEEIKEEQQDIPEPPAPIEEKPVEPEPKKDKKGKKKDGKEKPDKGAKKKGKDKKDKKSKKDKGSKKSKKDKTDKEELPDLVLPYIPVTNQRNKAKPEEGQKMAEFLQDFQHVYQILDAREQVEHEKEIFEHGVIYKEDPWFRSNPEKLQFQGYKNDVVYRKKLNIYNGSSVEKRCRFSEVRLEEFQPTLIQVEPVGAYNIIPGLSFGITVTFMPETQSGIIKGNIVFLIYHSDRTELTQITVPLQCIPLSSSIVIYPEMLKFDPLPIWKAKEFSDYRNYKVLKISNIGRKSCTVAIHKMKSPLSTFEESEENLFVNESTSLKEIAELETLNGNKEQDNEATNGTASQVSAEETELIAKEKLDDCINYVFDTFQFEAYHLCMGANSERQLKVYFRNINHVGNYNEKYLINVYEEFELNIIECVGSQELMISAELTGKFIQANPNTLDFTSCVFNSVYQLSFTVHNKERIPHGVGVKFPSSLKTYLSSSDNDFYIQPDSSKRISIKFTPRKEIICDSYEMNYYDPETKILEFPIHVCVTSRNFLDTPPTKVIVYALLSDSNGLCLRPLQESHAIAYNVYCQQCHVGQCTCEEAGYMIDLGECTVGETVYTDIELNNDSYVAQNYGFVNLPECINISPNYGFGEITYLGVKKLKLSFSPEAKDIPNYDLECEEANTTVEFRISIATVKSIGGIKRKAKQFKYSYIKKSADVVEKELESEVTSSLMLDMFTYVDLLRREINGELCEGESKQESMVDLYVSQTFDDVSVETSEDNAEPIYNTPSEEQSSEQSEQLPNVLSNKLWIKATIVDPLCNLSHQYIEFPDTPCGSYSLMSIDLRADFNDPNFKCLCGYANKFSKCKKRIQFDAHFEIVSDNNEISVEPICGSLHNGEKAKLTLIARPELSQEVILQTARDIRIEELLQKKKEEWEIKRQKELAAKLQKAQKAGDKKKGKKADKSSKSSKSEKGKKDKKGKKGTNVDQAELQIKTEPEPEPMPEFEIAENEIIINRQDLYPAEMTAWKNMESYFIKANLCCTLNYLSKDIKRKPEKLYFTAVCKVIRPDFVHNLNTQHIKFGPTVIGMTYRTIISIQNIQAIPITPTITQLSPVGSFSCTLLKDVELPPEHILHVPLTYSPTEEVQETEYFEIISGPTVCPLIVSGEGVERNIAITPDFVVCRLEAITGGFSDCAIDINNQSKGPITIELIKICELEGEIKPIEKEASPAKEKPTEKPKKGKDKKEKGSKGKKGKGDKPKKLLKFSQELTDEEKISLENDFTIKQGESYFEIIGANGNLIDVDQSFKKSIKIRFGVPLPPEEKQGKSKDKKKKAKKEKSPKSSKGKQNTGPQKYFVAKYNIMLGKKTFLKDAIILATFK